MRRTVFIKKVLVLVCLCLAVGSLKAQRLALRTNGLYWATLSPNIGLEMRLSRRFTLDMELAGNPFKIGKIEPNFFSVAPEVKYWLDGRPHSRHYVGAMLLGAAYDTRFNETCKDGTLIGLGATYGYSLVLGQRWSLEGSIGLGVARISNRKYNYGEGKPDEPNNKKFLPFPLKLGVSVVYILK